MKTKTINVDYNVYCLNIEKKSFKNIVHYLSNIEIYEYQKLIHIKYIFKNNEMHVMLSETVNKLDFYLYFFTPSFLICCVNTIYIKQCEDKNVKC